MMSESQERAEQGILGCVLLDATRGSELRPEWFTDIRCRRITEFIQEMVAKGEPISVQTVASRLLCSDPTAGHSLLPFLTGLPEMAPIAGNFDHWREGLVNSLNLRRIANVASCAVDAAQALGANSVLVFQQLESQLADIATTSLSKDEPTLNSDLDAVIERLEAARLNPGKLCGVPTAFKPLDEITSGFQPGQLIVFAGRPGDGKTSLAMNIAEHLSLDCGLRVGIFSLEMSGQELLLRIMCSRARVDSAQAISGELEDNDFQKLVPVGKDLRNSKLHICDTGGLTIAQLASSARRLKKDGAALLVVDYLGLLRSGQNLRNRYEEVTLTSNSLKALAKELKTPILCLAQLNRESERDGRPPFLRDLRDSGSIEQDADVVGLLHPIGWDCDSQPVDLIIAKNRTGRCGKVKLIFNRRWTRFECAEN